MTAAKQFGRPLLFKTPEELQLKIQDYFDDCDSRVVKQIYNKLGDVVAEVTAPYTVTGLAYYLGTSRETLINYSKRENFFDTINKAKAFIESRLQESSLLGHYNPAITIFSLKNNYNWKEKTEVDANVVTNIVMTDFSKAKVVDNQDKTETKIE